MYQKMFPAKLQSLHEMLDFIQAFGEKVHMSTSRLNQMIVAAEEALVNIIDYGYPNKKKGTIHILCEESANQKGITIIIKDQGVPFNPIKQAPPFRPPPLVEGGEPDLFLGGYGIYLLTQLMDKVDYQRLSDGNVLLLTKYI
ncbi:MAG: ATP-binding protein [Parachlamydiaceae bacterium]